MAVAPLVLATASHAVGADVISTWNGSTGNWSDAARWSSNPQFPNNGNGGFTYDAVINAGTVTLDRDITIEALNLGGLSTTLTQVATTNFTLTLNNLFTWAGGRLGGPGVINANGGIDISGGENKRLGSHFNTGRTLVNSGVANFSGAALLIESSGGANPGSLIQNNGTFNATDAAGIQHSDFTGSSGRFANAGTFNKSGVGTTTDIDTQFTNTGTVNVNEGTLELGGGGSSTGGTFDADAGATLLFDFRNFTMDNMSVITGAGNVTFGTGTHTLAGMYLITGVTTVATNATLVFNTPAATLPTLALTGGTLGGTGSQNITTAFNWTGGRLADTGTTTVDTMATLTMSGGENKRLGSHLNTGRTLVNNGVTNLSGVALLIESSGGANPGSLFQNNGTFNATDAADIQHVDFSGSAGRFHNAGNFNKGGVGTTTDIDTQFTNTGAVNVNEGELNIIRTFTNYNATTDTLSSGTYNVTSTFRFANADINTNQASITLNGPTSQIVDSSGASALSDFSTNDTAAFFAILNNRNFTTTAAFTNRGQLRVGGGTFNAASITNAAGGEFFGFGTIADAIANSGTVRAAGGTLVMGGIINGQIGTIQINPGASLDLSGAGGASDTNLLIHNGNNLNVGANNVLVRGDYDNANFGVGNAFNPRANVAGSGQIVGDGVAQSLTGDVTGGTSSTATMDFGNIHVGDSITRNYRINNAGSATSARLRGAIQTTAGGGNLTDARLSGAGVTAGNFGPIAGLSNSGDLAVTFTGASAGALAGQQVRIANNFDNVADQLLQFSGTVYRLAVPSAHTPEPVNFGIVHVGDTLQQTLSITNTAPSDGFSERLDAAIGNPTGSATTNGGSFSALAPGATNNSSLVVGIDTSSAGAKSGTATITLTSNGAGTSGLPNTPLTSQIVNVQAQVNNFAVPDLVKLGGDGTFNMIGPNEFSLDLGSVIEGQASLMAELGVMNDAIAPADELAGSFTSVAPDFSLTGFTSFSAVVAGSTRGGFLVQLDSSTVGTFAGEITLQPRSTNPRPFSMNLAPITVHLMGEVRLAGDYNQNGVVDAADYVVWRKNDTTQAGYNTWRANFGQSAGSGSNANAAIPEPTTLVLLLVGMLMTYSCRRTEVS